MEYLAFYLNANRKGRPVAVYANGEVWVRADRFWALTCSRVMSLGKDLFVPPSDILDTIPKDLVGQFERNIAEWTARGIEAMTVPEPPAAREGE